MLRAFYESDQDLGFKITAINEIAEVHTMAHLTRYDSTHGKFFGCVNTDGKNLKIDDDLISVSHHHDLNCLPWLKHDIDIVIESSGSYSKREQAELHIKSGAKRVLFSQPADRLSLIHI